MTAHAMHTEHRGALAVERIVASDGEVVSVIAIPQSQFALAIPPLRRLPTGEVVRDEVWHRIGGIVGHAACGERMDIGPDTFTRPYRLDDQLCDRGCWSAYELAMGKASTDTQRMRAIQDDEVRRANQRIRDSVASTPRGIAPIPKTKPDPER